MTSFLEEISGYQDYLGELANELNQKDKEKTLDDLSYADMLRDGLTKSLSVRLPVSILAKLDHMKSFTPYHSKGEMISKMIESSMDEFISTCHSSTQDDFSDLGTKALYKASESNKKKDK